MGYKVSVVPMRERGGVGKIKKKRKCGKRLTCSWEESKNKGKKTV